MRICSFALMVLDQLAGQSSVSAAVSGPFAGSCVSTVVPVKTRQRLNVTLYELIIKMILGFSFNYQRRWLQLLMTLFSPK